MRWAAAKDQDGECRSYPGEEPTAMGWPFVRMPDDRLPKSSDVQRKRGGQKLRYRDVLNSVVTAANCVWVGPWHLITRVAAWHGHGWQQTKVAKVESDSKVILYTSSIHITFIHFVCDIGIVQGYPSWNPYYMYTHYRRHNCNVLQSECEMDMEIRGYGTSISSNLRLRLKLRRSR